MSSHLTEYGIAVEFGTDRSIAWARCMICGEKKEVNNFTRPTINAMFPYEPCPLLEGVKATTHELYNIYNLWIDNPCGLTLKEFLKISLAE